MDLEPDYADFWGCLGCGRTGNSARDLLSQGCEGKPEQFVPITRLEEAIREIRTQHAERVALAPGLECTCEWCTCDT